MRIFTTILFLATIALTARSQAPIRLPMFTDGYLDVSVKNNFTAFFDSSGQMDLTDIRSAAFVPLDSLRYPHGSLRNNDCRIWLHCKTDSLSLAAVDTTPLFYHFHLRHTKIEGFRIGTQGKVNYFQWGKNAKDQSLPTIFLLPFEQYTTNADWYFRIQPFPFRINDFSPRLMSMKGWQSRSAVRIYDMRKKHNIMLGLVGVILFVIVFSITQWAIYRLKVFLYYSAFLAAGLANIYRYEMEYAIPVTKLTAFLSTHGDFIATYLGHTFYFLFINKFLKLSWRMPGLYRITSLTAIVSAILFFTHFIIYYLFNRHDLAVSLFLSRFALLSVGFYALMAIIYKRPPFYIFIFCGGLSVTVGALIWMISGYRLEQRLPAIPNADVSFYLGVMFETLFFISGLGYQFKISEVEKRKAKNKLLDERERITRDLHDDVGSTLNSLAVMSELANRQSKDLPKEVVNTLENIKNTARDTVQRISDIVWSINPNITTVGDLIDRMRHFTFTLFSFTDTRVRFLLPENLDTLPIPADMRWQIYIIFKEAVNNACKYADASLLRIKLEEQDGKMRLSIEDNGKGFDMGHVPFGNGLRTLQERASALGGTVTLRSRPGEGTLVELNWLLLPNNSKK